MEPTPDPELKTDPEPSPTPDVREPAAPIQFHWAYVLVPLGAIAAIGGGIGVALFIRKRREGGCENEEDDSQ